MWNNSENKNPWTTPTWIVISIISIGWWVIASQGLRWRLVLVSGLSLASFMVGCLVGFLLTSYGEETGTVGKIRDWLIGGITGLTIAKAGALKGLLLTFAAGPGPSEFALAAASAVAYAVLGFFFMFFQRELILNVLLAESRAERGRLEGTGQAGQVIQRFLLALPASILSGVDDVDEIVEFRKSEAEKLRILLYSDEVQKFLDDSESAVESGVALDWDIVSKAANLHYYRTYFEKEENKLAQATCAHGWIVRALTMNPLHVDFTVKYADTLGMMDRYEEAVAILERLEHTPEAPAYVKQWLGYFLLFVDRMDDAIRYSEEYHRLFPAESDSVFNVASAYAQKYCGELSQSGQSSNPDSVSRKLAISNLREALRGEPEYAETVRTKWTEKGESFDCFLSDRDFRSLVGLPVEPVPSADTVNK
jgi:tetratricopeptide (TPR) repeat protein